MDVDVFASDLGARRVPHRLVAVARARPVGRWPSSRRAAGRPCSTSPGIGQSQRVWDRIADEIAALAPEASTLTVSGSFPPGTDPDLVRRLTRLAHEAGLRVVLDVSGAHLSRALSPAGPTSSSPTASRRPRP